MIVASLLCMRKLLLFKWIEWSSAKWPLELAGWLIGRGKQIFLPYTSTTIQCFHYCVTTFGAKKVFTSKTGKLAGLLTCSIEPQPSIFLLRPIYISQAHRMHLGGILNKFEAFVRLQRATEMRWRIWRRMCAGWLASWLAGWQVRDKCYLVS